MPTHPAAGPAVLLVAADSSGMEILQAAADTLDRFGVAWHRAGAGPETTGALELPAGRWRAIIAASPDAELPGRCASRTGVPTVRVPVEGDGKSGLELLRDGAGGLPAGEEDRPFATMAIGAAGAKNAALFLVAALAVNDPALREKWLAFRTEQTAAVLAGSPPSLND